MPAKLVPMVEPVGVGAQQPAHPGHQIAPGRLDDQMKVVSHQTIGMNLETGLRTRLAQGLEEIVAIPFIQEDRLALGSPAYDVINRSGIFNAHLARHECILPQPHPPRKPIKWTKLRSDPFD